MSSDGTSKKQRKKLEAARRVAAPGTLILAYATGTGHARISKSLVGLVVGFAALFVVVLLAVHVALIPGFVLVVVAIGLVRPKRGVALTPDAVLVFHESMWNGTPKSLIVSAPVASLSASDTATTGGSRVSLLFGTERITLKKDEFERLLRATAPTSLETPPV
jgi:hypothetical protein